MVNRSLKLEPNIFGQCFERISNKTKGTFRVMTGFSDIFYVAKRDFERAVYMFDLASECKMFQEIAVPTIFGCFDDPGFIDDSGDDTNYLANRKPPWEAFEARRLLMHPFKFSNLVKSMAGDEEARRSRMLSICLFCMIDQYIKYVSILTTIF